MIKPRALLATKFANEYYFDVSDFNVWLKRGKWWIRPLCSFANWQWIVMMESKLNLVKLIPERNASD